MTAAGSGFTTTTGYLVTAAHVVRDCSQGRGQAEVGGELRRIVQFDPTHHLALLESPTSNAGHQVSLSVSPPTVGEHVAILGFPAPPEVFIATSATVVAVGQTVTSTQAGYSETLTDAIEVKGPIKPGESGAPAINAQGDVVGVVEIGGSDGETGYLVPASALAAVPRP